MTECAVSFDEAVDQCYLLLLDSVRRRVAGLDHLTILFSGGLDSMILAALACDLMFDVDNKGAARRIDLMNVSFAADAAKEDAFEDVPDRVTGRNGYAELMARSSVQRGNGLLNFIAVNVRKSVLDFAVGSFLPFLIYPHTTVMDATICGALWFAGLQTSVASKVILLGHGADELCAGYSRHAQAFERRGGNAGVNMELELDLERMWERNLGRDDRIISSLGKEARHPFLDERFIRFVYSLPVEHICELSLPKGQGDKKLLRAVARTKLALPGVSTVPKRAIQFGTRIAKFMPKSGRQQIVE